MLFFFFKQKTAYEMRISDWSSDVCSSDLHGRRRVNRRVPHVRPVRTARRAEQLLFRASTCLYSLSSPEIERVHDHQAGTAVGLLYFADCTVASVERAVTCRRLDGRTVHSFCYAASIGAVTLAVVFLAFL